MMVKFFKIAALWLTAALAWATARIIAEDAGLKLGAVPTLIILAPFLYAITRVLKGPRVKAQSTALETARRLQAVVNNPAVSTHRREEAKRRLENLKQGSDIVDD